MDRHNRDRGRVHDSMSRKDFTALSKGGIIGKDPEDFDNSHEYAEATFDAVYGEPDRILDSEGEQVKLYQGERVIALEESFPVITVYSDQEDGAHPYEIHNVSDHLRDDISEDLDIEVSVVDRFENLSEEGLAETVEELTMEIGTGEGLEVGGYWVNNAESTLLDEDIEAVKQGRYIDIKDTNYRFEVGERRLYVEEFQEFDEESMYATVEILDSEEELEQFAEEIQESVTTRESI
ncbi:MAG: hypothetical protein R6V35_05690 [Candidatus Nanohaloarchaea archaeon]